MVPEAEDKDTVKNEHPSDHLVNGKGIALFFSFLFFFCNFWYTELFGSGNLISCL